MISLSKSKEYTKLASQVPSVFTIEKGKKVLSSNDIKKAGIHPVNTKKERYHETLKELKELKTKGSHSQKQTPHFTNKTLNRASLNLTTNEPGQLMANLNTSKNFDLGQSLISIQVREHDQDVLNASRQTTERVFHPFQNLGIHEAVSTPIARSQRRRVNFNQALKDRSSVDALSKQKASFAKRQEIFTTLNLKARRLEGVHASGAGQTVGFQDQSAQGELPPVQSSFDKRGNQFD